MRLKKLFLLDMRFQAKYGFYFLYVVLTVIYIAALFALPENWKEKATAILIFSDPASWGCSSWERLSFWKRASIQPVHWQFLLSMRRNM